MVSNRRKDDGRKVVQSCVSSKAGVSGCSSSSEFLGRSSSTADKTVLGSHLPRNQSVHPLKLKMDQERTETLHECITHRAHSQPVLHHVSARL
jgi:hypothetical protein